MNKPNIYSNSLITDFRYKIYHKFLKALTIYDLIDENDKIMVAISGGKDSFILALCFKEIHKWTKIPFEVEYVCMDPGYEKMKRDEIVENAKLLDIPLKFFETNIFKIAAMQEDKECYICAKMRRGALYNKAQELGCNKVALGQHFDDVIETTLMSIFYSGKFETMLPILSSDNYENMKLIRPLYLVKEEDIIAFKEANNLKFLERACTITKNNCENSKRKYVKDLIKKLKLENENIDQNIFNSASNVNLDKILAYKKGNNSHE
ncbi:MAG: hypothetical protein K6G38_00600 [Gammaproteobacteria bacterium]|nr:hypothetical protein [Gammaproteobacteria bacterium]